MTTRFTVRHALCCSPDEFWEHIHHDPAFHRGLNADYLGHRYEVIEVDREAGIYKARTWPQYEAPAAVQKFLDRTASFTEEGVLDYATMQYDFRIVPSVYADKLSSEGHLRAEPARDGECDRVVDFVVEAKVLGIGRLIESFLEKSTRESFDQSAVYVNEYLRKKLGRGG